jgi:hypothetical protein
LADCGPYDFRNVAFLIQELTMLTRTFITSIATLFLATTGAAHAGSSDLLPPKEYDYPFDGPIVITRKSTPQELSSQLRQPNFRSNDSARPR